MVHGILTSKTGAHGADPFKECRTLYSRKVRQTEPPQKATESATEALRPQAPGKFGFGGGG